jgi:hypothetical protein
MMIKIIIFKTTIFINPNLDENIKLCCLAAGKLIDFLWK